MFELLKIGEMFLGTISSIGNTLINYRLSDAFSFTDDIPVVSDVADSLVYALGNPSLAEMLFGAGLITVVSIKLFKFFKELFI